MFSRILLFFPFSLLPDDGDDIEGTTNAVSDKFISVAIFCFSSSEMSFSSRQTAAGFPPVISKHLDNYKYGRVIISFFLSEGEGYCLCDGGCKYASFGIAKNKEKE